MALFITALIALALFKCPRLVLHSIRFEVQKLRYQWLHRFDGERVVSQFWEENHRQKHQFVRLGGV